MSTEVTASVSRQMEDEKILGIKDPVIDDVDLDDTTLDIVKASEGEYTEEQYRRVLRKADWILLPLMWLSYGLQQADKKATSTQATFGLKKDTGLVGQQYAWLSTMFYLSYLCAETPANFLLQRYPVGKALGTAMFIWGLVVLCIAFCTNFSQLMVLRTLQGLAECFISPSFLLITGAWYRQSEQAHRAIIWGTANAGFDIISGLICYGIGTAAEHAGNLNKSWKYISYFLGGLTILTAIPVFFILGTPSEVPWLSAEDRRIATARVVANQTGTDAHGRRKVNWKHVKEAFIDPQTWFLWFCVFIGSLPNGGTTTFVNLVYTSFGFSALDTLLKGTTPANAFSTVWFIIVALVTLKWKGTRFYMMLFSLIPGFVGLLVMGLLPSEKRDLWVKWAMFLISVTANVVGLLLWTFVPSNVAGRTKKTVTSAMLFCAYCVGNAVGAQMFQASDAPLYHKALIADACLFAVEFFLLIAWRTYYVWQNNRRDRIVASMGLTKEQSEHQGKLNAEEDMSDWSNVHFRYTI